MQIKSMNTPVRDQLDHMGLQYLRAKRLLAEKPPLPLTVKGSAGSALLQMIYFTWGVNFRVKPKGRAALLPLGNPIALCKQKLSIKC